jgi:hypothetical protein
MGLEGRRSFSKIVAAQGHIMVVFIPSQEECSAIEARLANLVGIAKYDKLFLGFEVAAVFDDVLVIRAHRAESIEQQYATEIASLAAAVLRWPLCNVTAVPTRQ